MTLVLVGIAVVNFPDALLLLRVMELGFSTTQVVLAYVAFNVVYTLGAYPAGVLADRWPRPLVYAVGLVAFGVGYLGLGLVSAVRPSTCSLPSTGSSPHSPTAWARHGCRRSSPTSTADEPRACSSRSMPERSSPRDCGPASCGPAAQAAARFR